MKVRITSMYGRYFFCLQLAWEVLELAKIIILKRGQSAWKLLAEAHRLLGEVAMESGNQPGALVDLNACLDLLRKIEPADPRTMAETHYQLGKKSFNASKHILLSH